jgi:heterodisulfide reductase subunit C
MEPGALGLDMHRVSVEPFLEKWPLKLAQREAIAQEFDLSELQTCAACKACDDDCPVAQTDDSFVPSAIMGQLLAGDLQGIFERGDIWRCTDCLICYERCHSRFGMAEVFQRVKMMARQEGKVPVAVLSNYQTFRETGMLGTPRQSAREKLGLSPLPEDGSADLKSLLREKGEQE